MPLPTESLTPDSSNEEIRAAISRAISMLVDEGREQEQAVAIAMQSARDNAGKVPGSKQSRGDKLRRRSTQGELRNTGGS